MAAARSRSFRFLCKKPPRRILVAYGNTVRAYHIRPWVAGIAALVGIFFAVGYFGATGYLVFRDDLLAASFARAARMKQAYEDRIAAMRVDIDRLTSRQLLDQEAVEAKLDHLVGQQQALDARQDILAGLSRAAQDAGVAASEKAETAAPAPAENNDLTTGSIEPSGHTPAIADVEPTGDASGHGSDELAEANRLEAAVGTLARNQVAYVEQLAAQVEGRSDKLAAILKRIGYAPDSGDAAEDGIGGPYVPLDEYADPETFRETVDIVSAEIDRFSTLRDAADRLPLTTPVASGLITSGFGVRRDPFLHRPAMHTGIDFREAPGYPARATAAGKVVSAGYAHGYGNMVEIAHGNGITTRYAHLSSILVKSGQSVAEGAIVGKTGSTGRSTGPHLHYEVRVNGRAVDPMTFIDAGRELAALM